MKQFNLEEWLQDKSIKVVTREGKDVKIIYTNSPVPHHPIVGFIDKSIYTWTIDGKLIYGKEEQDKNDLFFTEEEDEHQSKELTEFEIGLLDFADEWEDAEIDSKILNSLLKKHSKILLDLARKELKQEMIEALRIEVQLEDTKAYQEGVKEGRRLEKQDIDKEDALKDLSISEDTCCEIGLTAENKMFEEIDRYCTLCMDINCFGCQFHDIHFRDIIKNGTIH